MVQTTGYILYNLNNERYLARRQDAGGEKTHRWDKQDPLFLCENALDMLFNISSHIPRSRFPSMKADEFNVHVKRIRNETKQILSYLKNCDVLDEIMVVPVDIDDDKQKYGMDFVKAFKLNANMV